MSESKKQVVPSEFTHEKNQQKRDQLYDQYVKQMTPKHSCVLNFIKAYISGGIICVIGQLFLNFYTSNGADKELAASYTSLSLIFLAVLFTGFNWYQKIAKFAGAGSLVPITGFANSVASPAIEFKKEGQVFGIGCKIFTIAGPVILYGIVCSWALGIIYWILKLLKIV